MKDEVDKMILALMGILAFSVCAIVGAVYILDLIIRFILRYV